MAVHFAICVRSLEGCSRQLDKTFKNVVIGRQRSTATWPNILANAKWSDPEKNEFVVELTEEEYDALGAYGAIFHDECRNQPRWQQQVALSGAAKAFGRFATPTDAGSAFTLDAPLSDDRLIIRLYKAVPPGAAEDHIAAEDLEEGQGGGVVTRWLRLFTPNDTVLGGAVANQQNVKAVIAGQNMIFDTGSAANPPLPAACATIGIPTSKPGIAEFPSNHQYRVVGPNGENRTIWTIYGRTLTVL